jgi:hypothetical protein
MNELGWFVTDTGNIYLKCWSSTRDRSRDFDFTTCRIENERFVRQDTYFGDLPSFHRAKKVVFGNDY